MAGDLQGVAAAGCEGMGSDEGSECNLTAVTTETRVWQYSRLTYEFRGKSTKCVTSKAELISQRIRFPVVTNGLSCCDRICRRVAALRLRRQRDRLLTT